MGEPLVSIIVPAYDPPIDGFRKCMESILGQTYKAIEVILVDDGSGPSPAEEMDAWARRDARVHVCHRPNGGVGKARNRGIELAQGKYINFVDADDLVVSSWLELAVKEAEQKNADIVYGCVRMVKSASPDIFQCDETDFRSLTYEADDLWRVQEMLLLNNGAPLPHLPYLDFGPYGKIYQTNTVKKVPFPEDMPLAEDQVFNHAILRQAKRAVITNIPAYYYVINDASATHKSRENAVEVLLDAMKEMKKYLFPAPEVQNAFYYRLIVQVLIGILMAHYYDLNDRRPFREKYAVVKDIFAADPVRAAVRDIRLDSSLRPKDRVKLWLFKRHIYGPFVLVWTLRLKRKQKQAKMER